MKIFQVLLFLCAIILMQFPANGAEAPSLYWKVFLEKCGNFAASPTAYFENENVRDVLDWPWFIRTSESESYREYFSSPTDQSAQFTAILSSGANRQHLHCSISASDINFTANNFLRDILNISSEYDVVQEKIDFKSHSTNSAELRQYYATEFVARVEGVFETYSDAIFVRLDQYGSLYIEFESSIAVSSQERKTE